jgi:hypothetical protein
MSVLRLRSRARKRFNPLDLGRETLRMWLSAKDIDNTALVTNDGSGLISSLKSRNLAGQTFTAATTARPTYSATGQGGVAPGFVADGVAVNMTMASTLGLPTGSAPSVMIALASGTSGATGRLFEYGVSTAPQNRRIGSNSLSTISASNGTTTAAVNTPPLRTWVAPVIAVGSWATDLTEVIRGDGGTYVATATMASLVTATTRARIFASSATSASGFWTGGLSELIILSGSIATISEAIEQIEGYIAWDSVYLPLNLAAAFPDSHPYKDGPP